VAFTFFVKADNCLVGGVQSVKPRSFSRYQGRVASIQMQGKLSSLSLEAHHKHGEMQVIPLGGGDNFWGADFLVAYILNPAESRYQWHICLS